MDCCHPYFYDHLSIRIIDEEEKNFELLESVPFDAVKPFESQQKTVKKTKTLKKHSVLSSDTDITDNNDTLREGYHKLKRSFILLYLQLLKIIMEKQPPFH